MRCERGRKDAKGERRRMSREPVRIEEKVGMSGCENHAEPSEAQPRSLETGRPAVYVCGCLCARPDQQLGESAGVSA